MNVGIGELKTLGYGTLGVAGALGVPATFGTSVFATAVAGYGIATSQGQVASGMGQFVTAFTGDRSAGQGIQQVGDIVAGPIAGVSTLVVTNDPAKAQKAANFESYITAGNGWVNSNTATLFISGAVDFGLSTLGVLNKDDCE